MHCNCFSEMRCPKIRFARSDGAKVNKMMRLLVTRSQISQETSSSTLSCQDYVAPRLPQTLTLERHHVDQLDQSTAGDINVPQIRFFPLTFRCLYLQRRGSQHFIPGNNTPVLVVFETVRHFSYAAAKIKRHMRDICRVVSQHRIRPSYPDYFYLLIMSPLMPVAVNVQLLCDTAFGHAATRVPSVHRATSQREYAAGICFTRNFSNTSRRHLGNNSLYLNVAAVCLSCVVQRFTSIDTRSKGLSATVSILRTNPKSLFRRRCIVIVRMSRLIVA